MTTLNEMSLTANWNWDGGGNDRWEFGNSVDIGGNLSWSGTATINAAGELVVQNGGRIRFEGQNGFDPYMQVGWNGGNYDLRIYDNSQTVYCGLTNTDFVIPQKIYSLANGEFMDFLGNSDVGVDFGSYPSSPNSGFVAFRYANGGTNIYANVYMATWTNMDDPGVVGSLGAYGDLTLGSNTTATDYDVALKMQGKDNSATIRFDNGQDLISIDTSIIISGDISISHDNAYYWDDSWRMRISDDNLVVERHEAGLWVNKLFITS
jgi:hypothetical protein